MVSMLLQSNLVQLKSGVWVQTFTHLLLQVCPDLACIVACAWQECAS